MIITAVVLLLALAGTIASMVIDVIVEAINIG
jgi:hypothetical protein